MRNPPEKHDVRVAAEHRLAVGKKPGIGLMFDLIKTMLFTFLRGGDLKLGI